MGLAWGHVIGIKVWKKENSIRGWSDHSYSGTLQSRLCCRREPLTVFPVFLFFFSFETWRKKKASTMPSASSGPPASRDKKARRKTTSS